MRILILLLLGIGTLIVVSIGAMIFIYQCAYLMFIAIGLTCLGLGGFLYFTRKLEFLDENHKDT